jgi:hypothetical protein
MKPADFGVSLAIVNGPLGQLLDNALVFAPFWDARATEHYVDGLVADAVLQFIPGLNGVADHAHRRHSGSPM